MPRYSLWSILAAVGFFGVAFGVIRAVFGIETLQALAVYGGVALVGLVMISLVAWFPLVLSVTVLLPWQFVAGQQRPSWLSLLLLLGYWLAFVSMLLSFFESFGRDWLVWAVPVACVQR